MQGEGNVQRDGGPAGLLGEFGGLVGGRGGGPAELIPLAYNV